MQHPAPTEPQSSFPTRNYADDEIDLFELVAGLWRRKWLIAGVTALATLLGLTYALLATPTFSASAFVRPPVPAQLVRINETGLLELTPEQAFERVVFEARSRDTQRAVFEQQQQGLLDTWPPESRSVEDVFLETFLPAINLTIGGMGQNDLITESILQASFAHSDSTYAAATANALIDTAHQRALESLIKELTTSMQTRTEYLKEQLAQQAANLQRADADTITRLNEADQLKRLELEDRIAALKQKAFQLREDRLTQLREAMDIAESLGIENPTTFALMARRSEAGGGTLTVDADMTSGEEPEYLRGTRMLKAEIAALKKRESAASYFPEIRDLEEDLRLLENNRQIEILKARENYAAFVENGDELRAEIARLEGFLTQSYEDLQLVRIDQRAIPPRKPEKPRKSLIVAAALVAGGMFGVLLALVLNAVDSRRRQELSSR